MAGERRRIYWDACVFLHFLEGTPDKITTLRSLLQDSANKNGIEIITSQISVVEVAHVAQEKVGRALDPEVEEKLNDLWTGGEAVELVDLHYLISAEARTLIRNWIPGGKGLRPPDAIHIATARHMKADEFHTYDIGLLSKSSDFGLRICEPYTCAPRLFE